MHSADAPPGVWTALVHSKYLAHLPNHIYKQQHLLGQGSQPESDGHLPNSIAQLPVKHQLGMRVDSALLQGGTITALLELITATAGSHTGLTRIGQVMRSQQRHLQRIASKPQNVGPPEQRDADPLEPFTAAELNIKSDVGVPPPVGAVKLVQQGPARGPADRVPVKSEAGGHQQQDSDQQQQAVASGRRQPRALAWHVLSSGVVQVAKAGLTHTVLQVRPPPPWSSTDASISTQVAAVKQEGSDANVGGQHSLPENPEAAKSPDDADMPDASSLPRVDDGVRVLPGAELHGPSNLSSVPPGLSIPIPYLTLHIQWQLTGRQPFTADTNQLGSSLHPASPSVLEANALGLQHGPIPNDRLHQGTTSSAQQGRNGGSQKRAVLPVLRCSITSDPALPNKVLESFQDMAGKLNPTHAAKAMFVLCLLWQVLR